jgi:4-amino-4-deoxy-L-arabinose transferase-like glycosyltransferase
MSQAVSIERAPVWRLPAPHAVILVTFLGFILTVNALWLAIDHRPPRWDESANLLLAETAYSRLVNFEWGQLLIGNGTARPNFIPLLSALTFPLVGRDYDVTVFLQTSVSLLVISASLYGIGTRLFGRSAALLAVVIYNTFPSVAIWSRYYTLDLPMTAAVTATIWIALVYAQDQASRRWVPFMLAPTVAIGMCAKHLYPVFTGLPLAWLLAIGLAEAGWRAMPFVRRHAPLLAAIAVGIGFGLIYHVGFNFDGFYDGVIRSFLAEKTYGWALPTLRDRIDGFYAYQLGEARGVVALIGLGTIAAAILRPSYLAFVWLWIAGSFAFLLFVLGPTMPYYYHPAMPAVALLAAAWASKIRRRSDSLLNGLRAVQLAAAITVGIIATASYLQMSLGTVSPVAVLSQAPKILTDPSSVQSNPLADKPYWKVTYVDGNYSTLPYPHDWPVDKVLEAVREIGEAERGDQKRVLGLGTNYEWFNGDLFNYRLKHHGIDRLFVLRIPIPVPVSQKEFLSEYHVLVLKSGEILKRDFYSLEWARQSQIFYDDLTKEDYRALRDAGWKNYGRFPLPDGTEATVWKSPMLTLRLDQRLDAAVPSRQEKGLISPWSGEIRGERRTGVLLHPVADGRATSLTWRGLRIPNDASMLTFGLIYDRGVCGQPVAPTRFRVEIHHDGRAETPFDYVLEPMSCEALRWSDFQVPLDQWQGRTVDLVISTSPAQPNNAAFAHAVWTGLEIR